MTKEGAAAPCVVARRVHGAGEPAGAAGQRAAAALIAAERGLPESRTNQGKPGRRKKVAEYPGVYRIYSI